MRMVMLTQMDIMRKKRVNMYYIIYQVAPFFSMFITCIVLSFAACITPLLASLHKNDVVDESM